MGKDIFSQIRKNGELKELLQARDSLKADLDRLEKGRADYLARAAQEEEEAAKLDREVDAVIQQGGDASEPAAQAKRCRKQAANLQRLAEQAADHMPAVKSQLKEANRRVFSHVNGAAQEAQKAQQEQVQEKFDKFMDGLIGEIHSLEAEKQSLSDELALPSDRGLGRPIQVAVSRELQRFLRT